MFFDIIILVVLVVIIYGRLKNVLGTRPEVHKTELSEKAAEKIFDIILKESKSNSTNELIEKGEIEPLEKEEALSETDKVLLQIPNFDKERFINNSKKAFEIIITSFSQGDVETLENLVSKTLLKKFTDIIEQRKNEGVIAETDFIGFEFAEIYEAKILKSGLAKISMKFVSEQVNILKDASGKVIEGDENFIQNITDVWTFERNITSTSPNWLLTSTKK
ncbi:MAG: Tim44/TimA family putative adaptor protein [Alphaproteobacteria bacterium]|nr:Tim44/TimA family putative adaptor protein [Alphaproteobacteria bacterium]